MLASFMIVAIALFSSAGVLIVGLCGKYRSDVRKKYKKID